MIKLREIINKLILERSVTGDVDWELYEIKDEELGEIFDDFLYYNNDDMTKHIPWKVISFPRLKKIWEDFVKIYQVRDTKGLEDIENIMQINTIKLWIITELSGHTEYDPSKEFADNFGPYIDDYIKHTKIKNIDPNQYQMNFDKKTGKALKPSLPKINVNKVENKYFDNYIEDNGLEKETPDELKDKLIEALMGRFAYYYTVDPKSGADYLSDYGLEPLLKGLSQLRDADTPEEKLPIIDQMLNVVHQRSDMAAWFVEGGSRALSKLSGMETENIKYSIKELSYRRLDRQTPPIYKDRAREIDVKLLTKTPKGRYVYETRTASNGNIHRQWIKPQKGMKIDNINTDVIVWCDCGNFTYENETVLWRANASHKVNSNGMPPVIRNPKRIKKLCKHLLAVLEDFKKRI